LVDPVSDVNISGTQDGVNKTYTLLSGLSSNSISWFYINGQLQTYGNDYTISGTILTIASERPAPTSTDILKLYGSVGYVTVGASDARLLMITGLRI
jgi:hypothetical protein